MAKVDDIAAALLDRGGEMTAMKLHKLLYYTEAWHLAITDQDAFSDRIDAFRDGPVVVQVWSRHRNKRHLQQWTAGDPDALDLRLVQTVDLVIRQYGDLSGDELSDLTHHEAPWSDAWEAGVGTDKEGRVRIDPTAMRRFYSSRKIVGLYPSDIAIGGDFGDVTEVSEELQLRLDEIRAEVLSSPTPPAEGNDWKRDGAQLLDIPGLAFVPARKHRSER